MKKILVNTGILTSLVLASGFIKETPKQFFTSSNIVASVRSSQKNSSYRHLHSLMNDTGFKTHFLGVKTLLGSIDSFKRESFMSAIRSHSFYAGKIDDVPSAQGMENKIYESVDLEGNSDFYFQHPQGMRHFSIGDVRIGDAFVSKLLNGDLRDYPSLKSFLKCTLGY